MTDDAALSSYTEEIMSEMRVWLHDNGEIEGTDDEKWDANKGKIAKLVSGWLLSKLGGLLIEKKLSWNDAKTKITAENFGDFLALIYESKMNSAAAQIVLAEMLATGKEPEVDPRRKKPRPAILVRRPQARRRRRPKSICRPGRPIQSRQGPDRQIPGRRRHESHRRQSQSPSSGRSIKRINEIITY